MLINNFTVPAVDVSSVGSCPFEKYNIFSAYKVQILGFGYEKKATLLGQKYYNK